MRKLQVQPDTSATTKLSSDADLHRLVSTHCHCLSDHPLLEMLARGHFSRIEVAGIYRKRKQIVNSFMPMLTLGLRLAELESRPELVRQLQINIADELGLDPETGLETGKGSHAEWGHRFQSKLDALVPPTLNVYSQAQPSSKPWNPYPLNSNDSLAVVIGMILATEKLIPIEYHVFLQAFQKAFPELYEEANQACLHLFKDHIKHDERRHLPNLIDGYLGLRPGNHRECRLAWDAPQQTEQEDLTTGIRRVLDCRIRFYDQLLEEIDLEASHQA